MVEYEAISVIIFKVKKDQPYFYLVKRSSEMPIFPDTWTPIAGTVTKSDQEVYSFLYDKLGDIISDMSSRLTAVRLNEIYFHLLMRNKPLKLIRMFING